MLSCHLALSSPLLSSHLGLLSHSVRISFLENTSSIHNIHLIVKSAMVGWDTSLPSNRYELSKRNRDCERNRESNCNQAKVVTFCSLPLLSSPLPYPLLPFPLFSSPLCDSPLCHFPSPIHFDIHPHPPPKYMPAKNTPIHPHRQSFDRQTNNGIPPIWIPSLSIPIPPPKNASHKRSLEYQ